MRLICVLTIALMSVSATGREATWDERQVVVDAISSPNVRYLEYQVVSAWVVDDHPETIRAEVWSRGVHVLDELCLMQTHSLQVSRDRREIRSNKPRQVLAWLGRRASDCHVKDREELTAQAVSTDSVASAQVIVALSNAADLIRQSVEMEYQRIAALPSDQLPARQMREFREFADDPRVRISSIENASSGYRINPDYGFALSARLYVPGLLHGISAIFSVRSGRVIVHSTSYWIS